MDFDLTDEQRMLQDSLQRLLAERCSFEQRLAGRDEPCGYSRALWSRCAEMGLLGLPFAEGDGGLGGGPVETLIVMQALGRALALEPYLPTVVLAGALLREAGSAAQRDAQVGSIVAGERTLAFACTEAAVALRPGRRDDPRRARRRRLAALGHETLRARRRQRRPADRLGPHARRRARPRRRVAVSRRPGRGRRHAPRLSARRTTSAPPTSASRRCAWVPTPCSAPRAPRCR